MVSKLLLRRWAYACGIWNVPTIVIHAPDYTHLSSGVRCLHLLCDRLNRLGVSAAVTARITDPRLNTPSIHTRTISAYPQLLDRSLVIYPEVIADNPLRARNVVRYLLNRPGLFTGIGIESYDDRDYFLHFADEFRPPDLKSRRLRLPLVDTTVFVPPPSVVNRNGFLVYSVRYQPDLKTFPDWVDTITTISLATPRNPPELARLYQTSRALIVGERTSAVSEALHCHCPIVILPHAGFDYAPVFGTAAGYGLTVGLDQAGLARATVSAPDFPAHYAIRSADADAQILGFVEDATRHFGLSGMTR